MSHPGAPMPVLFMNVSHNLFFLFSVKQAKGKLLKHIIIIALEIGNSIRQMVGLTKLFKVFLHVGDSLGKGTRFSLMSI